MTPDPEAPAQAGCELTGKLWQQRASHYHEQSTAVTMDTDKHTAQPAVVIYTTSFHRLTLD